MLKFGFSVTQHFGIPVEELVSVAASAGFSAVSPTWSSDIKHVCDAANERGLQLQSLHAPIGVAADMWNRDADVRRAALEKLIVAVEDAARFEIPTVVSHTWIGFDNDPTPTPEGLDSHEKLVLRAKCLGVRIAYENTEGEETLFALMEHFFDDDTVGYCWDSGHELCYNRGKDLLALLGDRLIMTHLNDNMGISSPEGKIYFTDDLHLMLFDGKIDWNETALKLKKAKEQALLNFELKLTGCEYSQKKYAHLSVEEYVKRCFDNAIKFEKLLNS